MPDTDVLVVGGSAAGLATAACLAERGVAYEVIEASDAVGTAWRHHYDRLHLHTPRAISGLPGLEMPRSWGRYPAREDVVRYLEVYARERGVAPHLGQRVTRLEADGDGWAATTAERVWRARRVVVATGATRVPVRPTWPGLGSYEGDLLHSGEYRNGEPWRGRPVVVVGAGNSACEQAIDLVEHGAHPTMAVRSAVNVLPRDVFGIVPTVYLGLAMRRVPPKVADLLAAPLVPLTVGDVTEVGLRRPPYGPNEQVARENHPPLLDIGTLRLMREGRIGVRPGIERFTPTGVVFTDGSALDAAAVVLATGYVPGLADLLPAWREVCDERGWPRLSGAESSLPGLWFCGFHVSRAGMLREIALEARRIAAGLTRRAG